MTSSNVPVTPGSGKYVATNSFTEDSVTKEVARLVLNNSSGTEVGTAAAPVRVDPTGSTTQPVSGTLSGITGSIGVYFDRANPSVNVGTPTVAGITSSVAVFFDRSNPSVNVGTPTIAGITGSVAVYFDRGNPSVTVSNTVTETNSAAIAASASVLDDWDETDRAKVNPIVGQAGVAGGSGVAGATTTRVVHVTDVASSVQLVAGTALAGVVGLQTTASLFTVSGSTSTLGNTTLVSPSANASFKVYAYSIQTTGAVSLAARFTTGAATGATELWRPLVTASGVTGVQGANLMSRPGAPIFVTGVSTTLSLWLDTATLVHYSVAFTKESA